MEEIVKQIHALAQNADDLTRKHILDSLRDVSFSIETSQDTMQRISYLVSPVSPYFVMHEMYTVLTGIQHLQPALVRVGHNLNIFQLVSESKEPLTVEELASKTSSDASLLGMFSLKVVFNSVKKIFLMECAHKPVFLDTWRLWGR
jgi:demethylsterigmatocystin 6-O-methyltransferase